MGVARISLGGAFSELARVVLTSRATIPLIKTIYTIARREIFTRQNQLVARIEFHLNRKDPAFLALSEALRKSFPDKYMRELTFPPGTSVITAEEASWNYLRLVILSGS